MGPPVGRRQRRVVAKVEHHAGELFPRIGFIVTNLETPSRAVVRFYNKRGQGRAVDQRGEASCEDDTAELPSVPVERGPAIAERDRPQPGQPVAAAGAAEGNRNVVVDQLAAAAGEDRRTVGKACPLLLAIVGGEPTDAAPVWKHTAADRGFAAASRVGSAGRRNQSGRRRGVEGRSVLEIASKWGKSWPFGSGKGPAGARPGLWLWDECRKRSQLRQVAVYCRRRESKMEIPVKQLFPARLEPVHSSKLVSGESVGQKRHRGGCGRGRGRRSPHQAFRKPEWKMENQR